ncbi:MAG TPA: class I SAM-dependent methyltransferase [Actinomycetota bacterium]|jgi:SAM-dependent methyltransferase
MPSPPDPSPDEVRAAWEANAAYWDDHAEAGGTWQRTLIQPAVERLLDLRAGERVLEIGCGNGDFARRMAGLGADVVASDFSERMLERATVRGGRVSYRLADATDEPALLSLGPPGSFSAIVSNMAIMDMIEIEPLVRASRQLLAPGGRFVFSVMHPAFNGRSAVRTVELWDDETGVVRAHSVKVSAYARPAPTIGVALEGQPAPQWYFHRPIGLLFDPWFRQGFVLDGLEEPVFGADDVRPGSTDAVFAEVPAVMVGRMRLGAA